MNDLVRVPPVPGERSCEAFFQGGCCRWLLRAGRTAACSSRRARATKGQKTQLMRRGERAGRGAGVSQGADPAVRAGLAVGTCGPTNGTVCGELARLVVVPKGLPGDGEKLLMKSSRFVKDGNPSDFLSGFFQCLLLAPGSSSRSKPRWPMRCPVSRAVSGGCCEASAVPSKAAENTLPANY